MTPIEPLPPFPPAAAPPAPDALLAAGLALRGAEAGDLPFLARLYSEFRLPALLPLRWPADAMRAFAEDQFRLQHLHFVRHFPAADFWVIDRAEPPDPPRAIGRLTLDRSGPEWRLVDVILAAEVRGQGLGGRLIRWLQESAVTAGAAGIALQVAIDNPRARALYARLGFVDTEPGEGAHLPMRWPAPIS